MSVQTIVITGGPCSGKTSAMATLRAWLASENVPAMFVDEAGTDLILEGTTPETLGGMEPFQKRVAALQIKREDDAQAAAQALEQAFAATGTPADVVIVCDRGVCDGAAYLDWESYLRILDANNLDVSQAMNRYDAVFCLESAAKMDDGSYTLSNNSARSESPQEAAALCDRTQAAWASHPQFHFITNEDTFDAKAEKLSAAIGRFISRVTSN